MNVILYSLISLTIIYIIHYLYDFLKKNLTAPTIKDYIHVPENEYSNIYTTINNQKSNENNNNSDFLNEFLSNTEDNNNTNDNLEEQKMSAKDELKDYFKDITDNNVSFSDEQNPDIVRMNNSSDFVSNNSVGGLQYESLDSVYNI